MPHAKNETPNSKSRTPKLKKIQPLLFHYQSVRAYKGIVMLPMEGKLGVYLAYRYYQRLLKKIKRTDCEKIMNGRIRISNSLKLVLLTKAVVRYRFNFI